jgi:putative FmdB family regulatory protein
MPFYEYQCKNCGHALEAMQKVSDSPLKKCPHCGKSQLQRLMSAPVFRLKGGGWYETDFKGEGDNKRNLADKPAADAPKEKDSTPVDAKGDAKNDVKAADSTAGEAKPKEQTADEPAAKKKVDLKRRRSGAKKAPTKAKKRR